MTNIVKNSDKVKWVYSGQRIAFDGTRSWSLGNYFAEKLLIKLNEFILAKE